MGISFHLMIAWNPELGDGIASEPGDRPIAVRGFAGDGDLDEDLDVARIWVPQLARGRSAALAAIGRSIAKIYKICPVVLFPRATPGVPTRWSRNMARNLSANGPSIRVTLDRKSKRLNSSH